MQLCASEMHLNCIPGQAESHPEDRNLRSGHLIQKSYTQKVASSSTSSYLKPLQTLGDLLIGIIKMRNGLPLVKLVACLVA